MNFFVWVICKLILLILLFILIMVVGLVLFKMLLIQNFLDIDFFVVFVMVSLLGVMFMQMEIEVMCKIEDSIVSIGVIKYIMFIINDGSLIMMVEFQFEKDVQEVVNDVCDVVSCICV